MNVEVIVAILSIVEVLIGLIATVIDKRSTSPVERAGSSAVDSSFQRFILSCVLVYVFAGVATAAVGIYVSINPSNTPVWVTQHVCWIVANTTIIIMIIARLFSK